MVELLAVIAILAILVIIVIPNVLRMLRKARKDSFMLESKSLYNTVMKQNFLTSTEPKIYSTGSLDLNGGNDLEYSITTNQQGQIVCFQVANTSYMWIYRNNGVPLTDETIVANEVEVADRDPEVIIDCTGAQSFDTTVAATFGNSSSWWEGKTPKSAIERIVFTYSYNSKDYDEMFYSDLEKVGGLTTYVKDNVAYIVINRNKRKSKAINMPEDSSDTFVGFTNLKNISGLKLLNFSNVTNMDNFFGRMDNGNIVGNLNYINGYETFDTSNVRSAKYAFAGVNTSSINLSNWNTKSLQDVTRMFYKSSASVIDLSGWKVNNISHFNDMFASNNKLQSVSLNGWTTKPSADYTGMFNDCTSLVSITASSGFNVSNNNIVMFKNDTKLIGASGTTFSTDKSSYAKIDGGTSSPGYFSTSTADGVVAAKLYNSGSVSGSYTDLTKDGSVPPDWNYYSGARLLEVSLYSMKTGSTKTLEISVPAGMYIVSNTWTKSGNGISSVNFTKLANQGTGSYSNAQTGTLKYTFNESATSSTVQLLVMFDPVIWDKHRKNASKMGTDNMTASPSIVVNYNNGSAVRKISNIHSAVGVGNNSDGMGYTFYSWNYNSNIYVDDATRVLGNIYLLSRDQSALSYFYKKITYETYATFVNTSGQTVRAKVENDYLPPELSSSGVSVSADNLLTGEWSNIYFRSSAAFPRAKYTVKSSDNPKIGSNLTVYINASVTTLSGQTYKFDQKVLKYTIKSKDLDITDLGVGSSNITSPKESYYEGSGYTGMLGIFTMYNKGYNAIEDIKVIFKYDTGTSSGSAPGMKVMAARPFLQKGQQATAKITIVNDKGQEREDTNYTITNKTGTTDGAYVSAASVANHLGLSGNYYLKRIEYVIPKINGYDSSTGSTNYLYHSGGNASQTSGGNFMGLISKASTSRCEVYYKQNGDYKLYKAVESKSNVTDTPAFSGYISKINTPLGTEFNAGDDIELAINVGAVSYPYTNTQAFSKPEVYLVLPFGINIDSVIINNSATSTTTEVDPVVTRVKTISIGDVLNNVYKITTSKNTWFGYLNIGTNSVGGGPYTSKWFRVKLTTDISMEYTSFNLRDSVYFKDANGHISIGGSYAKNSIADQYDVDNDGSTTDKFGTTDNANQIIKIYSSGDDE